MTAPNPKPPPSWSRSRAERPARARLGLAALVHGFARVGGSTSRWLNCSGKRTSEPDARPAGRSLHSAQAWRDLAGQGNAPGDVKLVLTGAFEPPDESAGLFRLMAFDPRDGAMRAQARGAGGRRAPPAAIRRGGRESLGGAR